MFVTLKVLMLIGPSNDGRRHGRGTYLLVMCATVAALPVVQPRCQRPNMLAMHFSRLETGICRAR
jgi:hypothetical protein